LFGVRRRNWNREQIAALRPSFELGSSRSDDAGLAVILHDGAQMKIAAGRPEEMRYVATLLRQQLDVPAAVEEIAGEDPMG
jgi:hypothetical protein